MYDHVDHELTREVLQMQRTDSDSIKQALIFAAGCLAVDAHNEDVPDDVFEMRAEHYADAWEVWEDGDIEQTVIALRLFWEV